MGSRDGKLIKTERRVEAGPVLRDLGEMSVWGERGICPRFIVHNIDNGASYLRLLRRPTMLAPQKPMHSGRSKPLHMRKCFRIPCE